MVDAARPEPPPPSERPPLPRDGAAEPPDRAAAGATAAGAAGPPHLADPRALTILTTEHWGLLTARSLVYNEAFSRGAMFLTFLSASLVALGFVAGGSAAGGGDTGPELPLVAAAILALDLFVGLATLGRLVGAGTEELRALAGIARVRHAYLEMVPGLEPYAAGPWHDDIASVLAAYGESTERPGAARNVLHGLTTMPGLVAVIDAAVAGGLAATLAVAAGATTGLALLAGVVAGVALVVVLAGTSGRVFLRQGASIGARFPPPGAGTGSFPGTAPLPGDQAPGLRKT